MLSDHATNGEPAHMGSGDTGGIQDRDRTLGEIAHAAGRIGGIGLPVARQIEGQAPEAVRKARNHAVPQAGMAGIGVKEKQHRPRGAARITVRVMQPVSVERRKWHDRNPIEQKAPRAVTGYHDGAS